MLDTQTILHSDTSTVPQRADQSPCASRVLLRAAGLTKSFGGRRVLGGVSLELREGEVVLLRGDNGSGKTTLLNILTGSLAPDSGTIHLSANGSEETFRFPRRWWHHMNPLDHFLPERVAREGVGRSWQDTRLFRTVQLADNVAVAEPYHPGENPLNVLFRPARVKRAEAVADTEAIAMLDALGLEGRGQSSADMISLGQIKRVAIARAASAGGKILFLDEPLAGLDNDGVQAVLRLLRRLAAEHKVTLVIIEHVWNVHHILDFATTLWTLRDGALTSESLEAGDNESVQENGAASLTCFQEFVAGLRLIETRALPRGATLAVYRLPGREEAGAALLEVEGLIVHRGRRPVIGENRKTVDAQSGLSFVLHDGDLAILQAPNGWGKTTLFEAVAGLLPAPRGAVRLLGKDMTRSQAWERSRAGLRLLRADKRAFPSLTVDETFALSGVFETPAAFASLHSQNMQQLSGGEQQAVSLGQMTASREHVYLLDEPFSALDTQHVNEMFGAVRVLVEREKTALLVALPAVEPGGGDS
jgi:ABC-type branched-subunit amino acid transport system ATPase component